MVAVVANGELSGWRRAAAGLIIVALVLSALVICVESANAAYINFSEYPSNPVFDPTYRAYYPCVLYDANQFSDHGTKAYYKMWFAGYSPGNTEAVTYSSDGITWSGDTVTAGIKSAGYHSYVVYRPDGYGAGPYYYKMWYWDSSVNIYSVTAMRTADSIDGVSWVNDQVLTEDAGAPLVTSTWPDWNYGTYGPATVFYNSGASNTGADPFDYTYTMYYIGTTGGTESIGLGYSADGVYWHGYGEVLPHGSAGDWDINYSSAGTIVRQGDGIWHFWYSGGQSDSNDGIGYASSSDGIHWTKDPANPMMHVSDGVAWRDTRCYTPSVLYSPTKFDGNGDECYFKMWFTGEASATSNRTVGYCNSLDPGLDVQTTASPPAYVDAGSTITYTVTASNNGAGPTTGATVTSPIPSGTSYVSGSTTLNGAPVADLPGGLPPFMAGINVNSTGESSGVIAAGAQAVLAFQVRVNGALQPGTNISNTTTLSAEGVPSAQDTVTVSVTPSVTFNKGASPANTVEPGQTLTYTVSVTNNGVGPVTNATITDAIPTGTTYVAGSTTLNDELAPDLSGNIPPFAGGMKVNSPGAAEGTIAAGKQAILVFQVQADEGLADDARVINTGRFTADGVSELQDTTTNSPAGKPSYTWYFAEGSTLLGFDEYILIGNPGNEDANVAVTYLTEDGEEKIFNNIIAAQSRKTIIVNNEMPGETGISAIINSDKEVICERSLYFNYAGFDGGTDALGVNMPSVDQYLAEGYTGVAGNEFNQWILLLNPDTADANVQIEYLFPGNTAPEVKQYIVPGRSRKSVNVDSEVGEGREVSAHITSDVPMVAERAMYFNYQNKWTGGHCEHSVTNALADWYLAEGFTGSSEGPFDEWILVANQNDQPADVTVTYMFPQENPKVVQYQAPANGRLTIGVNRDVGEFKMVSTHLHASLPIVVERAMYFNFRNSIPGGHDSLGAQAPVAVANFAEGYTGNDQTQFETWILIQNTSDKEKIVTMDYFVKGAEDVTREVTLPPQSRTTILANDVLGTNKEFSTRVTTKDGSATIQSERACYFNYNGTFGRAKGGHDVLAY